LPDQEMLVSGSSVVVVAIAVWFLGARVNKAIVWLRRFSIPVAVTGGFLFSTVTLLLHTLADISVSFDLELRDLLLLTFFASIGLSARIGTLKEGGLSLIVLILATAMFLMLQDVAGVGLASLFGVPSAYGLFAGSISLAGGHGTAIAWGQVAEQSGLEAAGEVGLAFATFGLVAGGLIGGPIAELLIGRNKLAPEKPVPENGREEGGKEAPEYLPALSDALGTLLAIAICVQAAELINAFMESIGITLPTFLCAMLSGIVLGNILDLADRKVHDVALASAGEISLQLFLVMSLMSVQLWVLTDALDIILLALLVQTMVTTAFAAYVVFYLMGRDYDAAIISAGFAGLGLGATPVGIANMNAVTSRHGPSSKAYLIVLLIGAFFLDIMNAFVIKGFLMLPILGAGQ